MSEKNQRKAGGDALIRRMVGLLQRVFYPETLAATADKRPFYQDLRLLRTAATFPAAHIRDYGTGEFSEERYEQIFGEIVRKVALNGTPAGAMRRRGVYLLHCVQDHWRHNWESYAHESKTAGEAAAREVREIVRRAEIQTGQAERPMAILAAVHTALTTGRPKKAKAPAPTKPHEIQEELF
jgi:hypothetical protein